MLKYSVVALLLVSSVPAHALECHWVGRGAWQCMTRVGATGEPQ